MSSFYESDRERIRVVFLAAGANSRGGSETQGPGSSSLKPRVLLADSHPPMRITTTEVLSSKCGAEVIGFAADGQEAIDATVSLRPDILIVEIVLPIVDGIQVTRLLCNARTETRIIILTGIVDASFQRAAMEAGARAYVIKARMLADLPLAVKEVLGGRTFSSPPKI